MRHRPARPPDFVAEIRLDPNQRKHFNRNGLVTGFVAAHDFQHPEGGLNDGLHFLVDQNELPLGIVGESQVWLLVPERHDGRFYPGFEFNIHAGPVVVGNGFITKVINEQLSKKT